MSNYDKRKLRRSSTDCVLGGVCAGLANFFDLDVVAVRVAMALLTFCAGMSLAVYFIMWIIIPKE